MDENMLLQGLSETERSNLMGNADCNMLWQCQWDNRFSYYVYVPKCRKERTDLSGMFVFIHGTGRRYETMQFEIYQKFAEKNNYVILFPLFPGGVFDSDNYNDYKLIISHGFRYDHLLLAMIQETAKRYGNVRTDKFFLAGHSGGGQFVNRFYFLHPDRLLGAAIGAPGRPTYLDKTADYYWGIRDWEQVFGQKIDFDALKQVPVIITVGEHDVKFIGNSPYGSNRNERMESLRVNFEEHGITVIRKVIPGMEHRITVKEGFQTHCDFCEELGKGM